MKAATLLAIYALFAKDARAWWYHKQLREQGNVAEARKRELNSIKSSFQSLKNAAFWTYGDGGYTVWSKDGLSRLSGYDKDMPLACQMAGIPGYNSRVCGDSDKVKIAFHTPIPHPTKDEPRPDGSYGFLAYGTFDKVLDVAEKYGAEIFNRENA